MNERPDYLPISMLNQLTYCERRFWLMYVCGEMAINAPVLEGIQQHGRVHEEGREREGERVIHRRVYVWSDRLCISGLADLVEERPAGGRDNPGRDNPAPTETQSALSIQPPLADPDALPWFDEDPGDDDRVGAGSSRPAPTLVPVEYKRGSKGRWLNDQLQLCAQALCLEERTGRRVERGEIFYWRSRRRVEVEFTDELRAQTEAAVARAFALLDAGEMPPPVEQQAKCRECSVEGICLPREVVFLTKDDGR